MATFDQLKQRLQQAKREAGARGVRVNVTSRKNIQIASNVGRDNAEERASAVQVAPIQQDESTG